MSTSLQKITTFGAITEAGRSEREPTTRLQQQGKMCHNDSKAKGM